MNAILSTLLICSFVAAPSPAKADRSDVGTIAGALLGGLLGSKVGKGKGQTVGAVVGAIAGGILGHEIGEVLDNDARQERDNAIGRCIDRGGGDDEWEHNHYRGRVVVEPAVYQYREYTECRSYYNQINYNGGYAYSEGVACRTSGQWVMVKESTLSREMPRGYYRYRSYSSR